MKIRSYDIFDTCLVRSCGHPEQIFHILAWEILGERAAISDINDFALIRAKAETDAKQILAKSQVTIKEIYDSCDFSSFSEKDNNYILQKELEIESRSLVGVKKLRDKILKERNEGYQIIYISDMYLPSSFLKDVLRKEGFWNDEDELYVSCEYGKSKKEGNLYNEILKIHHNQLKSWTHHGDNIESDVKNPKTLGIKSIHVDNPYSHYQRNMLDSTERYNGQIAIKTSGISRAILMNKGWKSENLIATDLIAPVFVPFVYNILSEARRQSIKSLYFLARDGQILYDIATQFKKLFPEISLHYLCLSRKTIYFPALKSYEDIEGIIDVNKTAGQNPLDVIYNYTGIRLESSDLTSNKSISEILAIPEVKEIIEKARYTQRTKLLRYFEQEGIATRNGEKKGVVDLRGTVKSLAYINDLLTEESYDNVSGFYFEVTNNRITIHKRIEYFSQLYVENYEYSDNKLIDLYAVLESYFCASNHGRTVGYEDKDSKILPIFEEEPRQSVITEIYNVNRDIVVLWTNHFIENYNYLLNYDAFDLGLSILKAFAIYPDREYLSPLSELSFSSTGIERDSIIRKLSFKEIVTATLRKNSLAWFTGCISWTFRNNGKFLISVIKKFRNLRRNLLR